MLAGAHEQIKLDQIQMMENFQDESFSIRFSVTGALF